MPKSTYLCNTLQLNIWNQTALPWAADATWYAALHTANPGIAGTQATNEVAYAGYARQPINRLAASMLVAVNVASNLAVISFPAVVGAPIIVTHVSVGRLLAGAGDLLYIGILPAAVTIAAGLLPAIPISAIVDTET